MSHEIQGSLDHPADRRFLRHWFLSHPTTTLQVYRRPDLQPREFIIFNGELCLGDLAYESLRTWVTQEHTAEARLN